MNKPSLFYFVSVINKVLDLDFCKNNKKNWKNQARKKGYVNRF